MSLLFRHLRIHQIFGANTDVGKTLLTSALVRASAAKGKDVFYLKPVSTGPMQDADDEHVKRYAGKYLDKITSKCLFRYGEPVSPHLAARLAHGEEEAKLVVPTDHAFADAIAAYVRECPLESSKPGHMYIETAGGVHSPTLSGSTQLDAYRPLLLPTILVGDSRLGGISATISSYESLLLRGYTVDAILLFRDEYYRNWEYLEPYFAERDIVVLAVDAPPEKHYDPVKNFELTDKFYQEIVPESQKGGMFGILSHLDICHEKRLKDLESMHNRTADTIWWPFVQHGLVKSRKDVTVIDSASGDAFSVYNGGQGQASSNKSGSLLEPHVDGSASWWTQALGHANSTLTLAAAHAAGRYGHVMFPQGTHLPALELAERLVTTGPGKGWASRAFYSDDGSTGMEVALKMALRTFTVRQLGGLDTGMERPKRTNLGILGLKGSYHGDTIGAMDACEDTGVYTCEWHEAKGYWFEPPSVSIRKGKLVISLPSAIAAETEDGSDEVRGLTIHAAYDVANRLDSSLARTYRRYIEKTLEKLLEKHDRTLAALVLEPIVMGAGGMIFVDPLFQRVLVDVVRGPFFSFGSKQGLPVIFDEVFIGLYRLGFESATSILGVTPDISVNAKILTGGLVPLAVTLASEDVFRAFLSEKKTDALLHGHSYTAYPVGCAVANAALKTIDKLQAGGQWDEARVQWESERDKAATRVWSFWGPEFVHELSRLPAVGEVMALGTVLAIKVADDVDGYKSNSAVRLLASLKEVHADTAETGASVLGSPAYGINFRTLGNVAYFMSSLNTDPALLRSVEDRIWSTLHTATA
ncbi:hypothetical protein EIP86_000677 [Pleurotus ostreatoroseus]|nr:hypothetical protein EIP86_000677 [Pleurotus ostreatoroseus]